jgi:hypothetical protein
MKKETKVALALLAIFAVGLVLVAVGLGVNTKLAALGVGIILCLAVTRLVAGGVGR